MKCRPFLAENERVGAEKSGTRAKNTQSTRSGPQMLMHFGEAEEGDGDPRRVAPHHPNPFVTGG